MPNQFDPRVERIALDQLHLYAGNPRTHSKKQIRQIAKSIERFGFTSPLLVSDELEVIAGAGRLLAAKQLGLSQVPVIRLSHLSKAERRAYVIADRGGKTMLAAALKKALLKKQLVTIDGQQRRMSRIDIIAEDLTITAMRGDKDARREALRQVQIIDKLTLLEPDKPARRQVEVHLKIGDEEVTRRIIEREEEQAAQRAREARKP